MLRAWWIERLKSMVLLFAEITAGVSALTAKKNSREKLLQ